MQINKNSPKFNAFDPGFYISRIADIFQFNNIPAEECIRNMLTEFKMPIGTLEATGIKIDEYYYKETIAEVIKKIIEIIKEESGKNYYFYFKDNAFHFCERTEDFPWCPPIGRQSLGGYRIPFPDWYRHQGPGSQPYSLRRFCGTGRRHRRHDPRVRYELDPQDQSSLRSSQEGRRSGSHRFGNQEGGSARLPWYQAA